MKLLKILEEKKKARARKERIRNIKKVAVGTTLGIAAGITGGILLAPNSGKETRDELAKTAKKLGEHVEEIGGTIKSKTVELKGTLDDKMTNTKYNVSEAKEKIINYLASKKASKAKNTAACEAVAEVQAEEQAEALAEGQFDS